jgi:RNA polymerase primary sigma factor
MFSNALSDSRAPALEISSVGEQSIKRGKSFATGESLIVFESRATDELYSCPCCAEKIRRGALLCRFCGRGISSEQFSPCPYCAEMIRKSAVMCRFCRRKVAFGMGNLIAGEENGQPALVDDASISRLSREDQGVEPLSIAPCTPEESESTGLGAKLDEILLRLAANDPVHTYLTQISHIPSLSPEEEMELAQREAEGGEDGAVARRELVQGNLRLVVTIATEYVDKGTPLIDLIQEGNVGLVRATEKFDLGQGFIFSNYATWWIRQAITRALAKKAKRERFPAHVVAAVDQLIDITRKVAKENGRAPTEQEVAQSMNTTIGNLREMLRIFQGDGERVLKNDAAKTGETQVAKFSAEEEASASITAVTEGLLREDVMKAMDNMSAKQLPAKERDMARLRFGLEDGRQRSPVEVAELFGVTATKVRQVEAKLLRKLSPPRRRQSP